ncbi:MAG TPA: thiamine-phosphate kinase [Gemmatimonadaceae bacterium]|nr:thiamine-phosphate kinase [Gemmatimonadaceae bacterium]
MTTHLPLGAGAEFDAIRAMLHEWGPHATGVGDDAALVTVPPGEQLVVSTDASVEGVHFRREWMSPVEIGERAASAALSDLAAMAATPLGMLLAIAVPASWQDALVELARGVGAAAAGARCPVVGGNLTRGFELSLTITVLGSTAAPLRRAGARVGDRVFVTGQLGGPAAALRALVAGERPAPAHRARFVAPVPRLAESRWLARYGVHAAIDISDGLLADAAHLARASGVSISIDLGTIPCVEGVAPSDAAASGEEYELLVTAPATATLDVGAFAREFAIPLSEIGRVVALGPEPVQVVGGAAGERGFDHLR